MGNWLRAITVIALLVASGSANAQTVNTAICNGQMSVCATSIDNFLFQGNYYRVTFQIADVANNNPDPTTLISWGQPEVAWVLAQEVFSVLSAAKVNSVGIPVPEPINGGDLAADIGGAFFPYAYWTPDTFLTYVIAGNQGSSRELLLWPDVTSGAVWGPVAILTPITAPPTYRMTDVGDLDGRGTHARALNNLGHVVGRSAIGDTGSTLAHAFVYRDGAIHDLGTLGGYGSDAFDINDAGDIVGFAYVETAVTSHAFLYRDGDMTDLGPPVGGGSTAYGVNSDGVAVGSVNFGGTSGGNRAFRYENGTMQDLGLLGGESAAAQAINSSGAIAGNSFRRATSGRPFTQAVLLLKDGSLSELGTFGGDESTAYDINDHGEIVGTAYDAGNTASRAFLYRGGVLIDLGTLPGDRHSTALGINDAGEIVGAAEYGSGTNARAFLYVDGAMHNLNDLVRADDPLRPYVRIFSAVDINETGQIAANGIDSRTGLVRAYLMTPLSPANLVLSNSITAGCISVTGKLTLRNPAPVGGLVVALSDTMVSASVPTTVSFLEGTTSKSFTVTTVPVAISESGAVTATIGRTTLSQPLTVRPIGLLSMSVSPTSAIGSQPVVGKARLECKAGPGPITVDLSSNNPAVANPVASSIVVPQSLQSVNFAVSTTAVQARSYATLSGTANGITRSRILKVSVAAVANPKSLKFGSVSVGQTSAPLNATLTNKGAVPFSVNGISLTGTAASWFAQTNNCPASLAPGASCTVSVTFKPISAASKSAKLSIATSATATPLSVSLLGTGVLSP